MAKDFKKIADTIVEAVGGEENVSYLNHCTTRLRFVLKDDSIPNDDDVANIDGVLQVLRSGGQYQVVIGNDVEHVFNEIHIKNDPGAQSSTQAESTTKEPIISRIFGFVAASMSPLMPAMLGGGMIKVIMTLLTTFGLINPSDSTAVILAAAGDVFFYFLPVFLAISASQYLGNNPYITMIVAGLLIHPNLVGLFAEGNTTFFGLPVTAVTYSSSVLPILLMVPIMYYLERFADKVSPTVLKSFMKPMIVIFIAIPIALVAVGPIGSILGNYLSMGVNYLYSQAGWLTITLLSIFMPFIVMTGMHWALVPIATISLAELGYDSILIITMFAYNVAIGAATLAVAFKNKDKNVKSEAVASGISAVVAGVTEPALYGVAMKSRQVLYAGMIGAGASGLYAGIVHLAAYSMGTSPSALSLLQMIGGEGNANFINGVVALVIAIVVGFVASFILYKPEEK
ncbi:PTS transporter subunit EIIC [Collinsella sp. zg1085]|uniref:PTS transporter subunit EIIC n=1 Tax=Collinsella sp. zg1085 TaxID=2844380 RepID=UPI001C0BCE02|nr:PTS transporter subunit EIIC [Collinsella sp. zg1085]QWT18265.1 PTS transporter subunit EIIC [Collinsella sp. zg1085]